MVMFTTLNNVSHFDCVDAYCEGVMDPSLYDQMLPSIGGYSNESSMFPIATEDDPWDNPICSYESTAKDKVLDLPSCDVDAIDLKIKPIHLWTPTDTVNWILKVAQENGLECEEIHNFRDVDGCRLKYMTEELFYRLEPNCGRALYRAMQNLKHEQGHPVYEDLPTKDLQTPLNLQELEPIGREPLPEDKRPRKGKVGRPRIPGTRRNKKQEKKTGRLWEFIRDLLLKPEYCPSLICWEDHDQGIFRFVHSEKVARLWGTLKENPKMTYEKLSRAMRYYYKSKVLQPVLGRRLVYKFGPTATGWRTPNPNFKNKDCVKSKL